MIGIQFPASIATMDRLADMKDWCGENVRGDWSDDTMEVSQRNFSTAITTLFDSNSAPMLPITFSFTDKQDAVLFKLTWGGTP